VRTRNGGAVAHRQCKLFQARARPRRADLVFVENGAQLRRAAAAAEAREHVLDGGEIEEPLHLGLVACALELAARHDCRKLQQRQRDRCTSDAVDFVEVLRSQTSADVGPGAGGKLSQRARGL
jgi:hypothetical protein